MSNLKKRMIVGITATALAVPGSLAVASSASAVDALTEEQIATLIDMTVEEKLAGDVYDALAAVYPDYTVFTRIGASEDKHLANMRTLLATYGIADPTADDAAGVFDEAAAQILYADLVAQGSASIAGAADAGQAIETMDIADIDAALALVYPADVSQVFNNLKAASTKHLAAFNYLEANPTVTNPTHGDGTGVGKQDGKKGKGLKKGKGVKGKGKGAKGKGAKGKAKNAGQRGTGLHR